MKTCKGCSLDKDLSEFHKNKGNKDGYHALCKLCKSAYDAFYRGRAENREKERLRGRERSLYEWKRKYWSVMTGAKQRNLEFSIDFEDVPLPEKCPILQIPLVLDSPIRWNKPSIDRIDSSKGYIKGNVWVISMLANTMKSLATIEQLQTFSTNILRIFPPKTSEQCYN
jgi:hypothetical protein